MRAKRLSSKRKLIAIAGCVAIAGLGAGALAGARWTGVYPTRGLVATAIDVPPPQVDWVHGPLATHPSILASTAAAASLIGGNFPDITAAGLGTPNRIEVSGTPVMARRSVAMRFGDSKSLYWVTADANPTLTTAQMREWPRQCACGRVLSLGATTGVLLNQTGRPVSVTWLDGTGYRWSVIVPPDRPRARLQVEEVARLLIAQQTIKAP